jgi:hypothetical protein
VTDTYQLVFRGEVIEGQHPAVVRKRLAMALKLDDERVQTLFTGNSVVIRKSVDHETAAKFQAVFKKAGARLRVLTIAAVDTAASLEPADSTTKSPTDSTGSGSGPEEWIVLPAGSFVLEPEEREPFVPRVIDTSHFALVKMKAFAAAEVEREKQEIRAPEFEVLPVGARISDERTTTAAVSTYVVAFELAEVGAFLGPKTENVAVTLPTNPDFDLAEPGTLILDSPPEPTPKAPDTSHLSVIDNQ